MEQCGEKSKSETTGSKKDHIPEVIPKEINKHIDDLKKRRSSIRRSTNGGFGSAFRGRRTKSIGFS